MKRSFKAKSSTSVTCLVAMPLRSNEERLLRRLEAEENSLAEALKRMTRCEEEMEECSWVLSSTFLPCPLLGKMIPI